MNPIILEIYVKNIIHNYYEFKKINGNKNVAAVVKSNAYGTGIKKISNILINEGCNDFFVATLDEGIKLRKINKHINIFILNGISKNEINIFIKFKLTPVINNIEQFNLLIKNDRKITIMLHYDTGINRLGLTFDETLYINSKIQNSKIKLSYIISHLVSAEKTKDIYNKKQLKKFLKLSKILNNKKFSLANSAGAFLKKDYHFNMIRAGISLYGGYGNKKIKNKIKYTIKLKTKIIQIKKIVKNQKIGYNHTFRAKKTMFIATLSIGYADGIPRNLSNIGYAYYKGYKARFLGNISMDTLVIDVTNFYNIIKLGDYVELINAKNDIEKIAKQAGTVSQEILTSFGRRVKIKYIE